MVGLASYKYVIWNSNNQKLPTLLKVVIFLLLKRENIFSINSAQSVYFFCWSYLEYDLVLTVLHLKQNTIGEYEFLP